MEKFSHEIIRVALLGGGLLLFMLLETAQPFREGSVSKPKRWLNNIVLGIINLTVLQLIFVFVTTRAVGYGALPQFGLLNVFNAPRWLKIIDTIVMMDLLLYFWHILIHRLPLFWRFHRVHHTDLDVDVSTSLRLHVVEVILAALVRLSIAYFLGADPIGILVFEICYLWADQFRHSNLELPQWLERAYWLLFVPPAMHRIHHSVDMDERHTNFGAIFSIWDRFLGTLRTGVDQEHIWFGVDGHIHEKKLDIQHLIAMPFTPSVK